MAEFVSAVDRALTFEYILFLVIFWNMCSVFF